MLLLLPQLPLTLMLTARGCLQAELVSAKSTVDSFRDGRVVAAHVIKSQVLLRCAALPC